MVIIKGEIKTSEIMSCGYNRNTQKWDVKFNNGKTYSYAYLNVEKLTDPEVLNPNMYRISREGREFFDVNAIYVFRSRYESYWHICFGNGSERDYRRNDLHIIESCLAQSQSSNVFELHIIESFRINIPLDRIAADEATEQKIYNMICENLHLSVEQVMAELDISRSTVFRDYAKIKKVTGAVYDKKTSTWTL